MKGRRVRLTSIFAILFTFLAFTPIDADQSFLALNFEDIKILDDITANFGSSKSAELYDSNVNPVETLIGVPSTVLPATKSGKLDSGKITWTWNGSDTLTITGTGSYATIPVNAFSTTGALGSNISKVSKLILKGTITTINRYAFSGCTNLTAVTFNDGLKLISDGAFSNCTKLRKVSMPASVTHVQDGAFIKTATITCANKNMVKYGNNGYSTNDYLGIQVTVNYSLAYQLMDLINAHRNEKGRTSLKMNGALLSEAATRGTEIAVLFNHTRPNGEPYFTVNGNIEGEVIARGGTTAKAVLGRITGDSSDESSILSSKFKSVGIACVQYNGVNYWVLLFGTKATATNYPEPSSKSQTKYVDFPYGTPSIRIGNSGYTHSFKISTGNIKLSKGATKTATLKLGSLEFVRKTTKWSSDNSSVAKVNANGVITAVGYGTTYINAGSRVTNRAKIKVTVCDVIRLYGSNKFKTATAAAKNLKSKLGLTKFDNIIIAYSDRYADALSSSYLASIKKAPVVLLNENNTSYAIDYIKANLKAKGTVYIMGSKKVVPNSVATTLKKAGFNVKRVAGADKYKTNLAALKEAGIKGKDIIIAAGTSQEGALACSSLGKPIMLCPRSKLADYQIELLKNGQTSKKCYLIGDTTYVSKAIENQMKSMGFTVTRISAGNPYDLSVAVAQKFFGSKVDTITLCKATGFADALAGGPIAYAYKTPVILITSNHYSEALKYAKSVGVRRAIVLGGTSALSDAAVNALVTW